METTPKGVRTFKPADRKEWRQWLSKNFTSTEPVALIVFHSKSNTRNLTIADAVEEALCFGWIDNNGMNRDKESMYLQFTRRKENGNWSKINRERALRMIREQKMTEEGLRLVKIAKKNGKWSAARKVDVVPDDLKKLLMKNKVAHKNFASFSHSARRSIIHWINEAKREETRKTRIQKTVDLATKNLKPLNFL
jgi:uncharacterized protein YdeI (YjbR/CyaY-like superfamily)